MRLKKRHSLVEAYISDAAGLVMASSLAQMAGHLSKIVERWPDGATDEELAAWAGDYKMKRLAIKRWKGWVAGGGPARAGLTWKMR